MHFADDICKYLKSILVTKNSNNKPV